MIVFSAGLGVGAGRLAAGGMCRFVNDTVLARASASEEIRRLDSAADFDLTMPLERDMKIEISLSDTKISMVDVDVNYIKTPKEDELGISRHTDHAIAERAVFPLKPSCGAQLPARVGLTHIGCGRNPRSAHEAGNGASESFLKTLDPGLCQSGFSLCAGSAKREGSDSFSYFGWEKFLCETGGSAAFGNDSRELEYVVVIGTYEDNEYCSGDDILIRMEDYHKLYSDFSITDETFYFERIGTIVKKGGDDGDS